MLKIRKLKFSGIGRFVEPQEINFESLGLLTQIEGQNNNTQGSSGAGKSSIFNALSWLLGLDSPPTTILQSRLTDSGISVTGEFDWDGKSVTIKRAKKLTITVDNEEFSGSSKIVEEKLDQIIGMPRHLFRASFLKKQGEGGWFLALGPSKISEFLTDVLGLRSISDKIGSVEVKCASLGVDKAKLEMDLQSLQSALKATEEGLLSLGSTPETNVTEDQIEIYKNQLNISKSRLELLQQDHEDKKQELEKLRPELKSVPFNRSPLVSLEQQEKEIINTLNELKTAELNRQNEVKKKISDLKLEMANKINALKLASNNESSHLKTEILKLNTKIQQGEISKKETLAIVNKLKVLKSNICYTCEQTWLTEKSKQEEQKLLEEVSNHKTIVEQAIQASKEIEEFKLKLPLITEKLNKEILDVEIKINAEIGLLSELAKPQTNPVLEEFGHAHLGILAQKTAIQAQEQEHNKKQNQENKVLFDRFFEQQKALSSNQEREKNVILDIIKNDQYNYDSSTAVLNSHKEALKRHITTQNTFKSKLEQFNQKIAEINQNLVDTKEKIAVAEEVKRCLKSYLSCSFDGALDEISENATEMLRNIPNMANATIRLLGTKETEKGSVKEAVNCVLDNEGEIDIPLKSLSGGERSSVDLAIDLSVGKLISERANQGLDLLVLDEPGTGLDTVCLEQMLEMLKTFASDRKILIVEHNPIIKDFMDSKITVIRDGETSVIKSA